MLDTFKFCFALFLLNVAFISGRIYDFEDGAGEWKPYNGNWHWKSKEMLQSSIPDSNGIGYMVLDTKYGSDELYLNYQRMPRGASMTVRYFAKSAYYESNELYVEKFKESHLDGVKITDMSNTISPDNRDWRSVTFEIPADENDFGIFIHCYNSDKSYSGLMNGCVLDSIEINEHGTTEGPTTDATTVEFSSTSEITTTEYPETTSEDSSSTTEYPDTTFEYPSSTSDATTDYPETTFEHSSSTSEVTTDYPETTFEHSSSTNEATSDYPETTFDDSSSTSEATTGYPETTFEHSSSTNDATTDYPETTFEHSSSTNEPTTDYPETTFEHSSSTNEATTEYPYTTDDYSTSASEATTDYPETTFEGSSTTSDVTTEYPYTTDDDSTSASEVTTEYPDTTADATDDTTTDFHPTTNEPPYETTSSEYPDSNTTYFPSDTTPDYTTTDVPHYTSIFYDFHKNSDQWKLGHKNGASWNRKYLNIPFGDEGSSWVLSMNREDFFSGTVLAESPLLVAEKDSFYILVKFWMNGDRDFPARLKIRKKNSFETFKAEPMINADAFGDQSNTRWLHYAATRLVNVGEIFSIVIEGQLGAHPNNSVIVDYIQLDYVHEIGERNTGSFAFDFEDGLRGWMGGNKDGGRWTIQHWSPTEVEVPQPAVGTSYLAVERFDIHSGIISIESPPFHATPNTYKTLQVKFWLKGSRTYPVDLRFRVKSIDGEYQELPFLSLANYGDAYYQDWVSLDNEVYIPASTEDNYYQIVVEADLGADLNNALAIDEIRVLERYMLV